MKAIVTTTIHPPTEALLKFSKLKNWRLYIIGDQKTPHQLYESGPWNYLSPTDQENKYPKLSKMLGWNSIQRRNLGFIEAIKDGAEIIATIDDDNIPYDHWGENILVDQTIMMNHFSSKLFDPLSVTSANHYWHRGYPPQLVSTRQTSEKTSKEINVKVQVDLWNGKPDVDAFSKMIHGYKDIDITSNEFPFASDKTIFSSQNAFFEKSIMPYYAVLPFCGRMDDIWGCIIMQKLTGESVVFNTPSTFHKRNEHNLISDLQEEVIGYEKTMEVLEKGLSALPERTQEFFEEYQKEIRC